MTPRQYAKKPCDFLSNNYEKSLGNITYFTGSHVLYIIKSHVPHFHEVKKGGGKS